MEMSVTSRTTITFMVQYFEPSEGGMEHDSFGVAMDTLEEAVETLRLAKIARKDFDWIITASVETQLTRGK